MNFAESSQGATAKKCCRPSECVPSMALILLVQVQPRVFTAKCSEPQIGISKGMVEKGASGVDGVTVEELGSYPAISPQSAPKALQSFPYRPRRHTHTFHGNSVLPYRDSGRAGP